MSSRTFAILIVCLALTALADDFKTTDGKEYKNATVTRVEADGIVVKTKVGISKLYFTELPKDVQERFHYDPEKAAAAQAVAARQVEESNKQAEQADEQRKSAYKEQQKQAGEQPDVQALADRLAELRQQEINLRVEISQAQRAKTAAQRRRQSTESADAEYEVLMGRFEDVRSEEIRVQKELNLAQHR